MLSLAGLGAASAGGTSAAEPFDEEGAGSGGRVNHRDEGLVGDDAVGNLEAGAVGDLLPRRRIGDAERQPEAAAQDLIDHAHDELDDRLGGIEGARVGAQLRVVSLEELLVEVDDGIGSLGGVAELVEDDPDFGLAEVGNELRKAGAGYVERGGLVVDLLEERFQERVGEWGPTRTRATLRTRPGRSPGC